MPRRDLALFPAPEPVLQRPTGNEVALRGERGGKVHRAEDESVVVHRGRRRPEVAQRRAAAYDGDSRRSRCGWWLHGVKHLLVAAIDPADLCRLCWRAGPPDAAQSAPTLLETP